MAHPGGSRRSHERTALPASGLLALTTGGGHDHNTSGETSLPTTSDPLESII